MATETIAGFLDANQVPYDLLTHPVAYTAQEVAQATHVTGKSMAKTVVVRSNGQLALAVVPANMDVDLERLREAMGTDDVHLAGEHEFADQFAGCQTGAAPPFGNLYRMSTWIDYALADRARIAFNAGTHTDVISMQFADYSRLERPNVARIAVKPIGVRFRVAQI